MNQPLTSSAENFNRRFRSIARFFHPFISSPWRVALVYLVGLTAAEAMTTLYEPRIGLIMHGIVLAALFLHASFWDQGRLRGFLLSLSLAPLIRLLSLSLPLPTFPFIYWYMVVGAPLLIAAFVATRIGKMNSRMQGLTIRTLPIQLLISVSGIFLGYLEYIILRPSPLVAELTLQQVWLPALILLIFTGFLEEWIFRGLMQYTAIRSFGKYGFYYVAVVFAVLHLGYRSWLDVFFVFAVAVFFGWASLRSGSIFGVTISHGLTNIGLFLVFPFLVGAPTPSSPAVTQPQTTPTAPVAQPAPGLLAPIATLEATRPWVPPTAVPQPSATPEPTSTPSATITETQTITNTAAPTSTVCGSPPGWTLYYVRAGDTLSALSRQLGVSIGSLMQANCLSSGYIQAGQAIYVPFVPPIAAPTITHTLIPSHTPSPIPPTQTQRPPTIMPSPTISETAAPSATHTVEPTTPANTPTLENTATPVPPTATDVPTLEPSPTNTLVILPPPVETTPPSG